MGKRIGIIGGTFNPIHIAHLIIAETFYHQLGLDSCFFVPAYISPFKVDPSQSLITPEHRLQMLEISLKDNKKFEIDTFEISKMEISYTVNTIKYFADKYPQDKLFLLIGDDQAVNFHKWKDWQKILELAQLCIARRNLRIDENKVQEIIQKLTLQEKYPVLLENPLLEISSEDIRARIKNNISIKYILHKEVEEYIRINNLYF